MKEIKIAKATTSNTSTIASSERVTIVAVKRAYKDKPLNICPIWDGKEWICGANSDIWKKEYSGVIVDENFNALINNNQVLVLNKNKNDEYLVNKDFIIYNMLLIFPNIADGVSNVNPQTLFYISNPEVEANKLIEEHETIAEAYSKIHSASIEDFNNIMYYLGKNPRNKSAVVVKSEIYDIVKTSPSKIVQYFDDPNSSQKVFIQKLLKTRILVEDSNGFIGYEGKNLGYGVDEVSTFIHAEKNDDLFSILKARYEQLESF